MATDWQAIATVLSLALSAVDRVIASYSDDHRDPKDALTVISALLGAVKAGKLDALDPAEAQAELDALLVALRDTDARIDALIRERFPREDPD